MPLQLPHSHILVRMLSQPLKLYSPSRCAIGHFSAISTLYPAPNLSTLVLHSSRAHLVALSGIFLPQLPSIPMLSAVQHYTQASHTSVAVVSSMLNDRLMPITTSYTAERGCLVRSSDNPSTSFSGRYSNMEDCHDEATENPMYQTYTRVLHW